MPELEATRTPEARIREIIESRPAEARELLALLQLVQARFRHLPEEALRAIAARLELPLAQVFAVAGFYSALSLKPKGEKLVKVCCGTACHLRGSPAIVEALRAELGLDLGETDPEGRFTLEAVNCLGACALAPVVMLEEAERGERTIGELTPASAVEAVRDSGPKGGS